MAREAGAEADEAMNPGQFDKRIRIERKNVTQDATYGTPINSWVPIVTPTVDNPTGAIWANVYEIPPSRAESVRQGLELARDQVRIRYRYRTDVDSSMRVVRETGHILQIVGGPSQLGRKEYSEIVCESYSS